MVLCSSNVEPGGEIKSDRFVGCYGLRYSVKRNETKLALLHETLVRNGTLRYRNQKSARSTHYQLRGLASTLRMPTAISPWQWQPWTAVSSSLGLISMA